MAIAKAIAIHQGTSTITFRISYISDSNRIPFIFPQAHGNSQTFRLKGLSSNYNIRSQVVTVTTQH